MLSFHSSAMFGYVFCLARSAVVVVAATAALLTRVCRALRLLFVLFARRSRTE